MNELMPVFHLRAFLDAMLTLMQTDPVWQWVFDLAGFLTIIGICLRFGGGRDDSKYWKG